MTDPTRDLLDRPHLGPPARRQAAAVGASNLLLLWDTLLALVPVVVVSLLIGALVAVTR